MADSNMQLNWTDEQWNKVRQVVYEEARRARVAGNFLPLYGPLEPDARYVSREFLTYGPVPAAGLTGATIKVDDLDALRLSTLQVEVFLSGAQVADPQLTSALTAFRRAANIVARLEDEIIFNGQPGPGQRSPLIKSISRKTTRSPVLIGDVIGGESTDGLLAPGVDGLPPLRLGRSPDANTRHIVASSPRTIGSTNGEKLVSLVSEAIGDLEEKHQLGPFACVLGQGYFTDVQTPQPNSMVLPQDRILPFLGGGALLRTSTLPDDVGMVIALSGEPIDLVVGTDVSVKFLQATLDPCFVFRVYEKIVLRIKQPDAIALIYLTTPEDVLKEIDYALPKLSAAPAKLKLSAAQAKEVEKQAKEVEKQVEKYRADGKALYEAGKYQEAMDPLAKAQSILREWIIKQIAGLLATNGPKLSKQQLAKVEKYRADAEALYKAGKYQEAMEALEAEAKCILGTA